MARAENPLQIGSQRCHVRLLRRLRKKRSGRGQREHDRKRGETLLGHHVGPFWTIVPSCNSTERLEISIAKMLPMRKSIVVLMVTAMAAASMAADTSPAKQALIRELLQATRASDRASDVILDLFGSAAPRDAQEKVRRDPHMAEIAEKAEMDLYDRYFTEKQLRDLVAFFKSETGQRYVAVSR